MNNTNFLTCSVITSLLLSCAAKKEAKKAARRGCEFPGCVLAKRAQNKTRILHLIRFTNTHPGTASIGEMSNLILPGLFPLRNFAPQGSFSGCTIHLPSFAVKMMVKQP